MSFVKEHLVWEAEEIRVDTEELSEISVSAGLMTKTVFVCNDHNQQGAFSVWGSPFNDHSKEVQIGETFNVSANNTGAATFDAYFPYVRAKVTYATAPTTGDLTVFIEKLGSV